MKKSALMIAAVVSGALVVSGCTTNPYTGEREAGKSGIGAGIGSLVGAGVGVLSSSKKDRGKGALIGAAAGAALGGGAGYYMDVQEAKLRDKMKGTGVSVTRSGDNIILNMPNNVTFDSNSATLKPEGANTLTGVAMVLKEYEKNRGERAGLYRQHRQPGPEHASLPAACRRGSQRADHSERCGKSHSHQRHGSGQSDRQQQHGRRQSAEPSR
ncbi:Inner membrane lipoprotein YiaD precursor [Leclercia adecarboxylata]|uniref:Inner membrane lipoprotein YiaD n=1 Tax=Leclercia adecarboxylata TaxID=83655 RepID=A0A4U9HEB8_9ENTR|nr:Inner membrane lipoprotein YiaD precursor [Leclercia adecarboxylata]